MTTAAYKRGFDACKRRAIEIAQERATICEAAAKEYAAQYSDNNYWSASETCAGREAAHIARRIQRLQAKS